MKTGNAEGLYKWTAGKLIMNGNDNKRFPFLNYCPKLNLVLCYKYDKTAKDKRLYINR